MLGTIETDKSPRRDVYQRARLFDQASFTHHAKLNLNLLQAVLDRYSEPGDLVIDPMGGSGSVFIGLLTGRRVVAGDVEAQWARLMRDNEKGLTRRALWAFATPGMAAQWDAVKLPIAAGYADLVVTSPPYFDCFGDWEKQSNILKERQGEHGLAYGEAPGQIANLHIYEEYLRAMRQVYAESKRVLRPGHKLVLVLKDVIRAGRIVPVVEDNLTLVLAIGFSLVERYDVPVRGTWFRNVNRVRLGQAAPESESVLVLEKETFPEALNFREGRRVALVELPQAHDGPGWVIAGKAVAHAVRAGFEVWTRSPGEDAFCATCDKNWLGPENRYKPRRMLKARIRREKAFRMAADLVKAGLRTGDEIAFYGSDERYGKYLCMRLGTLGMTAPRVLQGLNNGQRLAFLTQRRQDAGR